MGINVSKLVSDFNDCIGWKYVSPGGTGKDCSETGIDCSGMFVRAFRLQGYTIEHGSNKIWRNRLSSKGSISDTKNKDYKQENSLAATSLEIGMAVFKWNPNTPKSYSDGLGDYQHIGLVTSVNPLRIVHASTDGYIVREDKTIGKFCAWGKLKDVDYIQATQSTSGYCVIGGTLNVRAKPSKSSIRIGTLSEGTAVNIITNMGAWAKIDYRGGIGYVMTKYLSEV